MKCLNAGGKELLEKEDKNGNKWREKNLSEVGQGGVEGMITLDGRRDLLALRQEMGMNSGR